MGCVGYEFCVEPVFQVGDVSIFLRTGPGMSFRLLQLVFQILKNIFLQHFQHRLAPTAADLAWSEQ